MDESYLASPLEAPSLFSLVDCDEYPSLLEETISLESFTNESLDDIDVPPFPSDRTQAMTTVLDVPTHPSKFSEGLPEVEGSHAVDELVKAIITVPTGPRLRTMLKEKLCVSQWVAGITVSDAPEHTPWGDPEDVSLITWIAEGSLVPLQGFRQTLSHHQPPWNGSSVHTSSGDTYQSSAPYNRPLGRRASYHPSSAHRKASVFEQEITFDANGQRERWSLEVPEASMKPEMVDMMIELQDLNSFFKGGLKDLDQSVSILDKAKDKLEPPVLTVSNSNFTLPIPLGSDSLPNAMSEVPLAVRRGKKAPATLTFNREIEKDIYPGIPSAFLSPSTYSPSSDVVRHPDEPSLDLEDMVASLRSQCAPIQARSMPTTCSFGRNISEEGLSYMSMLSTGQQEDNEWAFADDLMACYGEPGLIAQTKQAVAQPLTVVVHRDPSSTPSPTLLNVSVDAVTDVPNFENDDHIDVTEWSPEMPQFSKPSARAPIRRLTTTPPSSPLPPRPALVNASTPKRIRGVLNGRKNVRFASLPNRQGNLSVDPQLPSPTPRSSTGTSIASHRPSPLRNRLTTPNHTTRLKVTPTSPLVNGSRNTSTPRPPVKKKVAEVLEVQPTSLPFSIAENRAPVISLPTWKAGRKIVSPKESDGIPRVACSSPKKAVKQVSSSIGHPFLGVPPESSAANELRPRADSTPAARSSRLLSTPSPKPSVISSHGVCSLGGPTLGKENRPRASSSPVSSRWSVLMKEASFRTGSQKEPSQKSRMPSPLRNILTRFK